MTALLAIDTATSCAVGLVYQQRVFTRVSTSTRQAAQEVLTLVDAILAEANSELSRLNAIAVVTGPGSFTGLRIGIGAAQGLGHALQVPLIAVSALALQAWTAATIQAHRHWLVAQPARDHAVYFGVYEIDQGTGYRLLGREQMAEPAMLDTLPSPVVTRHGPLEWAAVGNAWAAPERLIQSLGVEPVIKLPAQSNTMAALCELAVKLHNTGHAANALVLPNYLENLP